MGPYRDRLSSDGATLVWRRSFQGQDPRFAGEERPGLGTGRQSLQGPVYISSLLKDANLRGLCT